MSKIIEVDHPLVKHKLAKLRYKDISTKSFRELIKELSIFLTYEATRDLELESIQIDCWSGKTEVEQIKGKKLTIVPILRAGIGMLDGLLECLPSAKVSVVGLYRDEKTLEPISYYEKFTKDINQRKAIIIDPMLATAGSLCATIEAVKKAGCSDIRAIVIVAAPEGIANVQKKHPDVDIYCASIDKALDVNSYIIPGLGDAGDKIFGTK